MIERKKFVLVELGETEDTQERLAAAGLTGFILAFESSEVSAQLFESAQELHVALANLHSFCNSSSVYMNIPTAFMEQAEVALRRARRSE